MSKIKVHGSIILLYIVNASVVNSLTVLKTKMGLELYVDLMSQPCRALVLFCKATRIPYTLKLVALRKCKYCTSVCSLKVSRETSNITTMSLHSGTCGAAHEIAIHSPRRQSQVYSATSSPAPELAAPVTSNTTVRGIRTFYQQRSSLFLGRTIVNCWQWRNSIHWALSGRTRGHPA